MPKTLTFYWSPQRQTFGCDQDVSEGHGEIATDPSHDLAHLIIAANGGMAWQPQGDRTQVCWAEYNAVFLEHLFDNTCNAVIFGRTSQFDTLRQTLDYMTWFVTQHYAPFPVSPAIAARRFFQTINPYQITRLFPYYLQVKQYERTHTNYRDSEYHLLFQATDTPPVDELGWLAQWSIYRQLRQAQDEMGLETDRDMENSRVAHVFGAIATPSAPLASPSKLGDDSLIQRLCILETQQQQIIARLTNVEGAIASSDLHTSSAHPSALRTDQFNR